MQACAPGTGSGGLGRSLGRHKRSLAQTLACSTRARFSFRAAQRFGCLPPLRRLGADPRVGLSRKAGCNAHTTRASLTASCRQERLQGCAFWGQNEHSVWWSPPNYFSGRVQPLRESPASSVGGGASGLFLLLSWSSAGPKLGQT